MYETPHQTLLVIFLTVGGTEDGDDLVRFALGLLDHVKTIRLSKEVSEELYTVWCETLRLQT